jgi:hypothetical protein
MLMLEMPIGLTRQSKNKTFTLTVHIVLADLDEVAAIAVMRQSRTPTSLTSRLQALAHDRLT